MAAASGEAQFVIKNGSGSRPDVVIRAVLGGTVAELKAVIQRDYPGNPAPSEQTVRSCCGIHMGAPRLSRFDGHLLVHTTCVPR